MMEYKITLRKAQPFIWVIFVLAVIVIGFIYTILMKPIGDTHNIFYNESILQEQVYQDFYIRSKTLWDWSPLVIIIVMIIWAVIKIHEKGNYQ